MKSLINQTGYQGVYEKGRNYEAWLWNPSLRRPVYVGSAPTPERAAELYDQAFNAQRAARKSD
jgi:hypothetical protein